MITHDSNTGSALPPVGDKTLIFAHRGAMGLAPQNTMAAFSLAWEQGADGIELDVQCTKDGVPVVFHDDTLDALTNGRGRIRDYAYDDVRKADAGSHFSSTFSGERIPGLEEVLRARPSYGFVNIELKTDMEFVPIRKKFFLPLSVRLPYTENIASDRETEARRVADATADCVLELERTVPDLRKYLLISSFDPAALKRFKERIVDIPIAFLYSPEVLHDTRPYMRALGYDAFHPHFRLTGARGIRKAHEKGVRVNCWTVNSPAAAKTLARAGVDGIITNFPREMRAAIATVPSRNAARRR